MKKFLMILIISFALVGCSSNLILDFDKVNSNVSQIEIDGKNVFEDCVSFDKETLAAKYDLDTSNMEETLVMMPMLVSNANMYMVVKAKDGKINDVKKELDKIMKSYESAWGMGYAPLEYEKVNNRLVDVKGNYLIYIISPDNDLVYNKIINSK